MSENPQFPAPQAPGMGQPKYYSGGWTDFETNGSGFFIINGGASGYKNYDEAIWGRAGWRVNADGQVQLRGLVRKPGVAVASGENVVQLPVGLRPFWQRRFDGQAAVLALIGEYHATATLRGVIQVDTVRQSTADFLILDQVTFYVGS